MREAPDCRPPPTARHASQTRSSSTSHPPQQQDTVHRELRPGTGKRRCEHSPLSMHNSSNKGLGEGDEESTPPIEEVYILQQPVDVGFTIQIKGKIIRKR
jgi:hypothetical protein